MKIEEYKQLTKYEIDDLKNSIKEKWMRFSPDHIRLLPIYNKNALIFRIPEGVKVICDNTFKSSAANIIELPSTLEAIGTNAFCYLTRFKSEEITLPANVKYIADEAFVGDSPIVIITSKLLYLGRDNCAKAKFIVVVDEFLEHTRKLSPNDSDKIVSLSYYNEYKEAENKREIFESELKKKLSAAKIEKATPRIYQQYMKLGEVMKDKWPLEAMELSFERQFLLKSHSWKYSVKKGKNGKGLISSSGKAVIEEKYDAITCKGSFFNPSRVIAERGGKVDLYYINGDEIEMQICDLDKINVFDNLVHSKDLAVIERDGKFGMVWSRKEFLSMEYDMIIPNKRGFSVSKKGLWGYLFLSYYYPTWDIPVEFESVEVLSPEEAIRYTYCIKKNNKYKIVDGELKIEESEKEYYDEIIPQYSGFKVRQGSNWGIINHNGVIVSPVYEDILCSEYDNNDVFFAKKEGAWGALRREFDKLKTVKDFLYERIENGFLYKDGKYYMIGSDKGYNSIEPLEPRSSYFKISLDGKFGLANYYGREEVEPKYDSIELFGSESSHCKVTLNDKYGIITTQGDVILEPSYDEISHMEHYTVIVRNGNKYGCLANNDVFSGCKYDMVRRNDNGMVEFFINDKWFYLDPDLNSTEDPSMSAFGCDHLARVVFSRSRSRGPAHMPGGMSVVHDIW